MSCNNTCNTCNKSNHKTSTNNQWAGTAANGKLTDHKQKTEFSNEWISTNKMVDAEDVEFAEESDLLEY